MLKQFILQIICYLSRFHPFPISFSPFHTNRVSSFLCFSSISREFCRTDKSKFNNPGTDRFLKVFQWENIWKEETCLDV